MPEIIRRRWKPRLMVPGNGELVRWSNQLGIPTHTPVEVVFEREKDGAGFSSVQR